MSRSSQRHLQVLGIARYTLIMTSEQETAVLDRLLEPVGRCLSPEAARQLIALRADDVAQARIEELADKCTEGQLSSDERAEYEFYIAANNVIAILQAQARRLLAANGSA
jgi:DNA-binding FadR family transcriptional regulator